MLRSGRFKHRLLDDHFLNQQSSQAAQSLQPFLRLWSEKSLTDLEVVTAYLSIFSFLRRTRDFIGGPHQEFSLTTAPRVGFTCQNFLELLLPTLPPELRERRSLRHFQNQDPLVHFICEKTFRSIPVAVMRSLWRWQNGSYNLKLLTHVPDAAEVLELQCQGQRCVSMLITSEEIGRLVEDGRDVLGFVVHDLIHADHFFFDLENSQAQIQFSQKLRLLWQQDFLKKLLQEDSLFQTEFFYLMSDMNSVPLHLLKSLKTTFLAQTKRHHKISLTSKLPSELETHFESFFQEVLTPWQFSASGLAAARRLNTPSYQHPDDGILLHLEMTGSWPSNIP